MEAVIIIWFCIISVALVVTLNINKNLRKRIFDLERENINLAKANADYQWKYYSEVSRNIKKNNSPKLIPKGTIEAVKEAMKRAHPDNGGSAEDFQMYRRAYNILIGKESLN